VPALLHLTDTQLVTLAITLLAIFIAMLVNNHRMTRADRAETNAKLDSILAFMANIEQRVTRLEDRGN
jgi:hypothetical protein